jgi:hypothetical protein
LGFCTLKMEALCFSETTELWTTTWCMVHKPKQRPLFVPRATVKTSEFQLWPILSYCPDICLERLW